MAFPDPITHTFLCWSAAGDLHPTLLEQNGQPCKPLDAKLCCGHCLGNVQEGCQRGNSTKHTHYKLTSSLGNGNSKRKIVWFGMRRWALLLRPSFLAGLTRRAAHDVLSVAQGNGIMFTIYWKVFLNVVSMVWLLTQRQCKYSSCNCYPKAA